MTRRDVLRHGAIAPAAFLPQAARQRGGPAASRPNILLLMADQWRADCLGAAGNRAIHTPNLDQLAAAGVRFTNAYSATPTCTPARAALLTGLAPWNHGMLRYAEVGARYPLEMPRALRDAGYYTTAIGKLHYHPQRNLHGYHQALLDESGRIESTDFRSDYRSWFWSQAPNLDPDATGIGWNDFDARPYALPERLHPTAWTGQTAAAWIDSYQRREPFFLKVSFARPHSPYDPPERFWRRYQDAELPAAVVAPWAKRFAPRSGPQSDAWHGDLGAEQVRRSRQGYYGSVSFVDEQIGRVLEALSRRKLMDETLIIFFSDHGDMLGDHHLWRKSYAYAGSARVPMMVRWPEGMLSAPPWFHAGSNGGIARRVADIPRCCRRAPLTPARRAEFVAVDRRQGLGMAQVSRSRTRRVLRSGESLERAGRCAPQVHFPRARWQRAIVRSHPRPRRTARPLVRTCVRTSATRMAAAHDRPPGAARRPLGPVRPPRAAGGGPRLLAELPKVLIPGAEPRRQSSFACSSLGENRWITASAITYIDAEIINRIE